ncbi:MAG: hypothetical protein Q9166_006990 [cf. Caloplaca sp. 2 TL-2023]
MADGPYRYQQPGVGPYYYHPHPPNQHHPRHLARSGSPVNTSRGTFTNDTPSPSRSPVSQASHNPYGMFGQGHQQSQHVMMNGGSSHQRYMQAGMANKFQQQNPQQHHGQPQQHHHHHHQQQNHVGGHQGMGHQHTFSSGTMSNATPHFTPSHLHSGTPGNGQVGLTEPVSEHWQQQLHLAVEARAASSTPHHHCRKEGVSRVSKGPTENSPEQSPRLSDVEERNRATTNGEIRRQDWDAMDLSGQGLRALSPALFCHYMFLGKLFIDNNRLTSLHPSLGQLRSLTHLDASNNQLMEIPEEIGMLVNLTSLLLFDNNITSLPNEIGYLFKLEMLGVEGNPLDEELKEEIIRRGSKALVTHLRENTPAGPPPNERDWHILDETPTSETLSVLTYNILCERYATPKLYGYTPSDILAWDYRKGLILGEIKEHDADIVCLQEVDQEGYHEFFRRELAYQDYRGVFSPKTRAKTMADREAKFVDGCATFFKSNKYICLDKNVIDFANMAINRPDMKGEHDTFNRVMPRDQIAVVTFFENRATGSRLIVVNVHIHWDPAYKDVKLVQVAILMEQVAKLADRWAKHPPCTDKAAFQHAEFDGEDGVSANRAAQEELAPSQEYASGTQIPLLVCGDFNSSAGSGVYDLMAQGSVSGKHEDLGSYSYGNFTRDGMAHPFTLKSAYSGTDELSVTNYTPDFSDVIDYVWYSTNALQVRGVLGDVDLEYLSKVPGFPNHHFPSDHLPLRVEFSVKSRKEIKAVEAKFGPQKDRRS